MPRCACARDPRGFTTRTQNEAVGGIGAPLTSLEYTAGHCHGTRAAGAGAGSAPDACGVRSRGSGCTEVNESLNVIAGRRETRPVIFDVSRARARVQLLLRRG
ncbi:hypothetical protein EVAR_19539_1 [Eumeta japonica]|uniref:Uncharacterized protein n=1 Tax=Eumeta variegata TaxID=151549 RepID=A0A4C1UFE1_EUMVA|nr:hypothetical protein EVAR_19539_1 [Eumeta japonica]